MNILNLIIAGLVIGSASGAALASEFSPAQGKIINPAAEPQQGCGDCPPEEGEDGNDTSEHEHNETRPERPPEGGEEPAANGTHRHATEPVRDAVRECSASYEHRENGTFVRTAVVFSSQDTEWGFPVHCGASQVSITLKLSGLSGSAYLDFDNQMDVYDGNGTNMDSYRSSVHVDVAGDHAMYSFESNGQGEAGMWLFDLTQCALIGDYELVISVS